MKHSTKVLLAAFVGMVLCGSLFAQGTINLLDYQECTIKYYKWDYDVTQYDNDGNPVLYGWVGSVGFDSDRHKVISNSTANDPHVPIAEIPQGSTSSIRLGTGSYVTQFDSDCQLIASETAKGGGVVLQYNVTEENAILYIKYAALLTDALSDHLSVLESMMGQYCWQYCSYDYYGNLQCPYVYGSYAFFEYASDWDYQQPSIRFFLGVDGEEIDCASKHQLLYDTQGNRVSLTNAWRKTAFDVQDPSTTCGVYYHYDAYYRDWTLMAVDLTPYIGHTISFGAEYKDCAQAGWLYPVDEDGNVYTNYPEVYTCDDHHMARLYMTASCSPAGDGRDVASPLTVNSDNCLAGQISLQAPDGFTSYRWYSSSNRNTTLSTSQTCMYTFPKGEQQAYIYCDVTNNLTAGCGGQIETTTLKLYVENTCKCESEIKVPENVCADAAYLTVDMNYTQGAPTSFDIVFDEMAQAQGFQNITGQTILNTKKLEIPMPQPESGYVRPDRYSATLVIHQSCEEDKIIPFGFYVLYPSSLIVQKWNDVMAVKNTTNNGGYTFSSIRWYQNGTNIPAHGETGSYIYIYPAVFNPADLYWAELTRADDGKTLCTCPLSPAQQTSSMPEREQKIQLTAENDVLHITASTSGEYMIYDITGAMVGSGSFSEGEHTVSLQPHAVGTYLIYFSFSDGSRETRKVFIY